MSVIDAKKLLQTIFARSDGWGNWDEPVRDIPVRALPASVTDHIGCAEG